MPGKPLDPEFVRKSGFRNIDALLATRGAKELEQAADLLGRLNATAFSRIDAQTRIAYLLVLIKAWTREPQEKAIVEIFKSVSGHPELNTVIAALHGANLWEQLFDDLDDELWSLLAVLGRRFGDPKQFSFKQLIDLLLQAKLITILPGVRLTDKGAEISLDVIAEAYEAARSFIRFIGGFFESLLMFIAHPQKIVDGVGQLAKMIVTVQLAQVGDQEAIKEIEKALGAIGEQGLWALKSGAVTRMGAARRRRGRQWHGRRGREAGEVGSRMGGGFLVYWRRRDPGRRQGIERERAFGGAGKTVAHSGSRRKGCRRRTRGRQGRVTGAARGQIK